MLLSPLVPTVISRVRWKRSTPGEIVLALPEVSRKGRATMYRFSSLFRFVIDVHVID